VDASGVAARLLSLAGGGRGARRGRRGDPRRRGTDTRGGRRAARRGRALRAPRGGAAFRLGSAPEAPRVAGSAVPRRPRCWPRRIATG
jgi:hypothetical protein